MTPEAALDLQIALYRKMTGEERRFFELAGIVLQGEEDEDLAEGQCA